MLFLTKEQLKGIKKGLRFIAIPFFVSGSHSRVFAAFPVIEDRLCKISNTALAIAPDALVMALINLLENSLQHAADRIEITADFYPVFYHAPKSGSIGLGLEITRSLLKAYEGKIELAERGQGAWFLLSLPVSVRLKAF